MYNSIVTYIHSNEYALYSYIFIIIIISIIIIIPTYQLWDST